MKVMCTKCQTPKAQKEFYASKIRKNGCGECKTCYNASQKARYNTLTAEQIYSRSLRANYGIDYVDLLTLWSLQGKQCGVCGKGVPKDTRPLPPDFVLDHDHSTGKPRGVLCHGCNVGLGAFQDSLQGLQDAVSYIKQSPKIVKRAGLN